MVMVSGDIRTAAIGRARSALVRFVNHEHAVSSAMLPAALLALQAELGSPLTDHLLDLYERSESAYGRDNARRYRWDLGFRDEAGNVSEDAAGVTSDTVRFLPAPVVATIDHRYRMLSGDSGGGTFSLLVDRTFVDSSGATGVWTFQPAPLRRFILVHDAGQACDALLVGNLTLPASVQGPRVCRDGSGDRGVWAGTLTLGGGASDVDTALAGYE